jgi:multiple sugar transport system ATP-binding protein
MELYEHPGNKFVAGFIGSPSMNFFDGTLTRTGAGGLCTFRNADQTIRVPCEPATSERVYLGVRPQHLEVVGETAVGEGSLRAEVGVVEPMGNEQIVYLTVPSGGRVVAVAPVQPRIVPGEKVSVRVRPEGLHVFDAQTGKRIGK